MQLVNVFFRHGWFGVYWHLRAEIWRCRHGPVREIEIRCAEGSEPLEMLEETSARAMGTWFCMLVARGDAPCPLALSLENLRRHQNDSVPMEQVDEQKLACVTDTLFTGQVHRKESARMSLVHMCIAGAGYVDVVCIQETPDAPAVLQPMTPYESWRLRRRLRREGWKSINGN